MSGKTWIEISRSRLLGNVQALSAHVAPSAVMAVVKSNAYGHGLETVALTVARAVGWFGVDDIDEALRLREIGILQPVLILGYIPIERLPECAKHQLSFVAYDRRMLAYIGAHRTRRPYRIHIKIETGTSRQGIEGIDLAAFAKQALRTKGVMIEGVYTHFANIEDTTDSSFAMHQLQRFRTALESLHMLGIEPPVRHTASSAAAILFPETRYDVIRLGIAMYGHWPSKETQVAAQTFKRRVPLTPALSWKTVVAQVKEIPKGSSVSYGCTETVGRRTRIAVLPIGYWDGFDRRLSSVGTLLIRGKRAKVLGRVCMNMTMADVTDIPAVKAGDDVVIIGKQGREEIRAEDVGSKIGSIQYEVLARINPRIPRRLVA